MMMMMMKFEAVVVKESATDEIKSSFLIVPFTSLVFTSIIANIYEFLL
jgi:hypothetical protein